VRILRSFLSVGLTLIAAAGGGWAGTYVRARLQGEPKPEFRIRHTNAAGQEFIGLQVTLVHFLPGLAAALLSRPRWLGAFLGSFTAGALINEQYDDHLLTLLESLQPQTTTAPQLVPDA